MQPDIVSILRCPKSGSKLTWVSEGLLRSEDGHSYKVEEGIFHLLAPLSKDEAQEFQLRQEKEQTRAYYDDFGWVSGGETYQDAERFVDMRPAAWSYTARCIRRVRKHIPKTGRFILDVASGPIPYQNTWPSTMASLNGYAWIFRWWRFASPRGSWRSRCLHTRGSDATAACGRIRRCGHFVSYDLPHSIR